MSHDHPERLLDMFNCGRFEPSKMVIAGNGKKEGRKGMDGKGKKRNSDLNECAVCALVTM